MQNVWIIYCLLAIFGLIPVAVAQLLQKKEAQLEKKGGAKS